MYNNKRIKIIWTIDSIIAIVAILYFTVLPAFQ
jgi:hypothetical protein